MVVLMYKEEFKEVEIANKFCYYHYFSSSLFIWIGFNPNYLFPLIYLHRTLVVSGGIFVAHALPSLAQVISAWGLSCFEACRILVPSPGVEPMSSPLPGEFLSAGPPGKSLLLAFLKYR